VVKDIVRLVAGGVIAVGVLLLAIWLFGPEPLPASAQAGPRLPAAAAAARQEAVPPASEADVERLRARSLLFPVDGETPSALRDTFSEGRAGHLHEAADILAPRGTRVLAVDDGRVAKLFTSVRGGLTVYQFDGEQVYCYYYAHLDRYAEGLEEGALLRRGAVVGYVGTTGNAPRNTPHLHFAVFKLGPERRWWEGAPINPFGLWPR
jgi:murein DD-endopeptidase MepM/ murein hydrolase activator NlpD